MASPRDPAPAAARVEPSRALRRIAWRATLGVLLGALAGPFFVALLMEIVEPGVVSSEAGVVTVLLGPGLGGLLGGVIGVLARPALRVRALLGTLGGGIAVAFLTRDGSNPLPAVLGSLVGLPLGVLAACLRSGPA